MVVTELCAGERGAPVLVKAFLQASSAVSAFSCVNGAAVEQQRWVPPSLAQAQLLQETIQSLKDKAQHAFSPIESGSVCPKRETYCDGGLYGANCNYEFGFHGLQGRRLKCEDYVLHLPLGPNLFAPFDDCTRACLACVLDGHGGTGAVQYVAERFPAYLLEDLSRLRREPACAMRAALHRVDEELTQLGHNSGTTVNALMLLDDRLTVMNTGDCRCIVYDWLEERAVHVTHDHNLRSSQERERVRAAGAEVSSCGDYVVLPCPAEGAKLLGVTKALGHAGVKALQQRSATTVPLSGSGGSGSILASLVLPSPSAAVSASASSSSRGPSGGQSPGGDDALVAAAPPPPLPGSRPQPCGGVSGGGGGGGVSTSSGGLRPPFSLTGMSVASAAAAMETGSSAAGVILSALANGVGVLADCASGCSGSASGSGMSEDDRHDRHHSHHAMMLPTPLASIDSDGEGEAEAGSSDRLPCLHPPEPHHDHLHQQQRQGQGRRMRQSGSGSGGDSPPPASASVGFCGVGCSGGGGSDGAAAPLAPAPPSRSLDLPPLGRTPPARSPHFAPSVTFGRHSLDSGLLAGHAADAHTHAHTRHPHTHWHGHARGHDDAEPSPPAGGAAAAAASGAANGDGGGPASAACGGSFVLTCEPDVFEWTVQDDRHLVLLACDGVFDAMSNNEACTTALRQLAESNSCLDAARKVTDRALKKDSCDNITALVLRLGRKRITRRKSMSVLNLRRCGSNMSGEMAAVGGGSGGAGGVNSGAGGGGGGSAAAADGSSPQ